MRITRGFHNKPAIEDTECTETVVEYSVKLTKDKNGKSWLANDFPFFMFQTGFPHQWGLLLPLTGNAAYPAKTVTWTTG